MKGSGLMQVIKRDNTIEDFDFEKIINAISKSSERIGHKLLKKEIKKSPPTGGDFCLVIGRR